MLLSSTKAEAQNRVAFELPSLPGSVNDIYEINDRSSGLPRKRLKPEWAIWATKMLPYISRLVIAPNSIIRVDRCYHYPWFYGNSKWRRCDVANMDKLLFDTIAKKLGVDDLLFKQGYMDSRNSHANKVEIVLTEVTEAEWRSL